MTSLTGASGEDFASILRSLGYRMERRPKPAEPAPPLRRPNKSPRRSKPQAPAESNPEVQAPSVVEGEAAARESAPEVSHDAVQEPRGGGAATGGGFVTASPAAEPEETETAASPSSAVAEASVDSRAG